MPGYSPDQVSEPEIGEEPCLDCGRQCESGEECEEYAESKAEPEIGGMVTVQVKGPDGSVLGPAMVLGYVAARLGMKDGDVIEWAAMGAVLRHHLADIEAGIQQEGAPF